MNNTYYYRQANTRSSQKQLLPVNAIEVLLLTKPGFLMHHISIVTFLKQMNFVLVKNNYLIF